MNQRINWPRFNEIPLALRMSGIVLLVLVIILQIIRMIPQDLIFFIPLSVQEMGDAAVSSNFSFQWKNLFRILLLGPVHCMIMFFAFRSVIENTKFPEGKQLNTIKSRYEGELVFWLMTNFAGHIIHWTFDRANYLYHQEAGGYSTTDPYLLIYFMDEFFSHGIIHVSYFFMFLLACRSEMAEKPRSPQEYHWDVWLITACVAIGIVILNGEAAKVGESALILLILSIFATIYIPLRLYHEKKSWKTAPLTIAFWIGSIGVIGLDLYYFLSGGAIPYYPYIT